MGEVKNHIRNVKAEELMCMSHGHELRLAGWDSRGREGTGQRGIKGEKVGQL